GADLLRDAVGELGVHLPDHPLDGTGRGLVVAYDGVHAHHSSSCDELTICPHARTYQVPGAAPVKRAVKSQPGPEPSLAGSKAGGAGRPSSAATSFPSRTCAAHPRPRSQPPRSWRGPPSQRSTRSGESAALDSRSKGLSGAWSAARTLPGAESRLTRSSRTS